MPLHKMWVEKLEQQYKESADTLIPRLLTFYGNMEGLAQEVGVNVATISRWCDANGVERRSVFEKREAVK